MKVSAEPRGSKRSDTRSQPQKLASFASAHKNFRGLIIQLKWQPAVAGASRCLSQPLPQQDAAIRASNQTSSVILTASARNLKRWKQIHNGALTLNKQRKLSRHGQENPAEQCQHTRAPLPEATIPKCTDKFVWIEHLSNHV